MKKLFYLLVLSSLPAILFSCTSENGKDKNNIKKMETTFADKRDSVNLANALDAAYRTFLRKYPEDSSDQRMLFEDAQINLYPLHKTEAAVLQMEALYTKYPQGKYSANAMFKAAFLNENVLGRTDQAKALYTLFIKTYPTNPLAADAKTSLENIGLSPEQAFQKARAKQDSLSGAGK